MINAYHITTRSYYSWLGDGSK